MRIIPFTYIKENTYVCPNQLTLYTPNSAEFNGIVFNRLFSYSGGTITTGYIGGGASCVFSGVATNGKSYPIYYGQKGSFYYVLGANATTYPWGIFQSTGNYCFNGGTFIKSRNTDPSYGTLVDGIIYPQQGSFTTSNTMSELYQAYIVYTSPCP
jgi:hypothetical protein